MTLLHAHTHTIVPGELSNKIRIFPCGLPPQLVVYKAKHCLLHWWWFIIFKERVPEADKLFFYFTFNWSMFSYPVYSREMSAYSYLPWILSVWPCCFHNHWLIRGCNLLWRNLVKLRKWNLSKNIFVKWQKMFTLNRNCAISNSHVVCKCR